MTTQHTNPTPASDAEPDEQHPADQPRQSERLRAFLSARRTLRTRRIVALVSAATIVLAGSVVGVQLAHADAAEDLRQALQADDVAHRGAERASVAAKQARAELSKVTEAWSAHDDDFDVVIGKKQSAALIQALEAARTPDELPAVPILKRPAADTITEPRAAAAAAHADRATLRRLTGRISASEHTFEELRRAVERVARDAGASVEGVAKKTLTACPAASNEAKAAYERSVKAAAADFTPKSLTSLVDARAALVRSQADGARAAAEAAAGTSSGSPEASAGASTGSDSRGASRLGSGRGGSSGATGPAAGRPSTSGTAPAPGTGGARPSQGSRPGSSAGGTGGGGGGASSGSGAAPCVVSVVPVKSGAPSGPGTSGSQSGTVGGCRGPITVHPGIPSNADASVSSSGASWTVRWSVPLPSSWN